MVNKLAVYKIKSMVGFWDDFEGSNVIGQAILEISRKINIT